MHQESLSEVYNENSGAKHEHALFVGNQYVLKYTANPGQVQKVISLSKAMKDHGLNTPAFLQTADGKDWIQYDSLYFTVTDRIKGRPFSLQEIYYGNAANAIGQAIGNLHLTIKDMEVLTENTDLLPTLETWAIPTAAKSLNLPSTFLDEYLSTIRCLCTKLPKQPIHRDPNPRNILFDGSSFGFLDFELSEQNVRIYDPCYAATAILSESKSIQDKTQWIHVYKEIVNGYNSVIPLTPEERQAAAYIVLANQLICVAWFSEQEKYRELFEINKSMTLWLIDHFDDLKL